MPWYPLYHEDFAMDTMTWTAIEVGCLVRLMNYQWANGSVPDDQIRLAMMCGVTDVDEWNDIWETLRPKFEQVASAPGHLVNRRLAIEHERQPRKRRQATAAAETRWGKGSKIKQPDADALQTDMRMASDPEPEPDKKNPPLPSVAPPLKRKHRLPVDWETDEKLIDWAVEKVPDVNISYETEKFKDYFLSTGRTYVDWRRAWMNWMRKANEGGNHGRRERLGPAERIEKATGVKRL